MILTSFGIRITSLEYIDRVLVHSSIVFRINRKISFIGFGRMIRGRSLFETAIVS